MPPAFPLLLTVDVHQANLGFVHQGRGLQCLPGFFLRQILGGQSAQLIVNQRQQFLRCRGIASFNLRKNVCDVRHSHQDNVGTLGMPECTVDVRGASACLGAILRLQAADRIAVRHRRSRGHSVAPGSRPFILSSLEGLVTVDGEEALRASRHTAQSSCGCAATPLRPRLR